MPASASTSAAKILAGTELKIYVRVRDALLAGDLSFEMSDKYAYYAVEIYRYVNAHPELKEALNGLKATKDMKDGAVKAQAAFAQADRARNVMNMEASASRFTSLGSAGVGGALSAFVDYFASVAKSLGVEMNECCLAITKVILGALTIAALADTGVGAWAAAVQLLSTANDARSMAKVCLG
jgi:hypothetical protein